VFLSAATGTAEAMKKVADLCKLGKDYTKGVWFGCQLA
jgi:hypothetical protein